MKKSSIIEEKIQNYRKESAYFEEYIILFYVFIEKLWRKLNERNVKSIAFLSREGWFLKELFDIYQNNKIPKEKQIKTKYFKCSRHAIDSINVERRNEGFLKNISIKEYFSAIGFDEEEIECFDFNGLDTNKVIRDFLHSEEYNIIKENSELQKTINERYEQNSSAFQKYIFDIFGNEEIYLCDIGYAGTVQLGLENVTKRKTHGYYLGRIGDIEKDLGLKKENWLDKNGLLFDCNSPDGNTVFDSILRSNMIICEMLLYAPHGSVQRYCLDNEDVKIIEDWANKEKDLYFSYIKSIQERMRTKFEELCFLNMDDISEKETKKIISRLVLKSGLLPSKERIAFLDLLGKSMHTNYWRDTKVFQFKAKDAKINILDLILHPEKYTRYFVKLPMLFYNRKMLWMYYLLGNGLYFYICIKNGLL